jgi:ribosomal protein S18 acetylase RimI-like enzyme
VLRENSISPEEHIAESRDAGRQPYNILIMSTVEQLSLRLLNEFQTIRLRALEGDPTAFGSTYAKESQFSQDDWLKRLTTWNDARSVCYLGMDQGAPCGIIAGYFDQNDPQMAHVASMWVAPTHRRTGLGTMLMNAVQSWAQELGAGELRLMVTSRNETAISFYQQRGFTFTGTTGPYANDPALLEYEMVKNLQDPCV